jgi:nickel-dependent lactate racemase
LRSTIKLATHESGDQNQLAYLAADPRGEPIYLNRQLCEADFVIPIGYIRPDDCAHRNGHTGIWNSNLYPTFGDRKSIDYFSPGGVSLTPGQLSHQHRQIDQVAWLLGVQVTAQVVPGAGNSAWKVLFGSPGAVFQQGWSMCRTAWQMKAPKTPSLVVAGISGGAPQQTWTNVGHALKTALSLVNDGGAIALCTELDADPGPAMRTLADSSESDAAARLRKLRSYDAELARLLVETQDRVTVYLLSRLPEDVVEPLGFVYVHSPTEIARLAAHHDSCMLLPDAQFGRPPVTDQNVK